ncbi:Hypothetical predicted protein [Podarcis lilfordi]|uniref:Uncharacterized protein n=1 Tax=Podarcis lilfordi TaxID=74358 RepID=A0AA35LBG9_9SAUR|nr:Hypothetical predicted protein [Podarcis lilfordi]
MLCFVGHSPKTATHSPSGVFESTKVQKRTFVTQREARLLQRRPKAERARWKVDLEQPDPNRMSTQTEPPAVFNGAHSPGLRSYSRVSARPDFTHAYAQPNVPWGGCV